MQDVVGMPGPPVHNANSNPWMQGGATRKSHRVASFVAPAFMAAMVGALTLHLLAEILSHLTAADPFGFLAVTTGVVAVLVTLTPFTVLWVRRAQRAWSAVWTVGWAGGEGSGKG